MSEKAKLSIVTKEITFPEIRLEERLYRAVFSYQTKYGLVPDGLILGPREWLEFQHAAREMCHYPSRDEGPRFMGIPLYRSERPGIQLMPSESIVARLAHGIMKKRAK